MLQQEEVGDFVIDTVRQISVRDFNVRSAQQLGTSLRYDGSRTDEIGIMGML